MSLPPTTSAWPQHRGNLEQRVGMTPIGTSRVDVRLQRVTPSSLTT